MSGGYGAIFWVFVGCSYNPDRIGVDPPVADAPVADGPPGVVDAPTDVPPPPPPTPFHLYVEAKIDGRSNLIIQGTSVSWFHFQFAAPGRETFTNVATTLDTTAWQPMWPDVPDAENRDCNCSSDAFTDLPIALPAVPSTVTVTHVLGRRLTTPSAIQMPDAANDYTLILEFTDVGISGSDIYGANIDVVPL